GFGGGIFFNPTNIDWRTMLTAQRLRELLDYNPETGVFTWRVHKGGGAPAPGAPAGGGVWNGYIRVGVDRRRYRAHRLAWLYVPGEGPTSEPDHKAGDKTNTGIATLRLAPLSQNMANRRGYGRYLKGASLRNGRWAAQIGTSRGGDVHLGT